MRHLLCGWIVCLAVLASALDPALHGGSSRLVRRSPPVAHGVVRNPLYPSATDPHLPLFTQVSYSEVDPCVICAKGLEGERNAWFQCAGSAHRHDRYHAACLRMMTKNSDCPECRAKVLPSHVQDFPLVKQPNPPATPQEVEDALSQLLAAKTNILFSAYFPIVKNDAWACLRLLDACVKANFKIKETLEHCQFDFRQYQTTERTSIVYSVTKQLWKLSNGTDFERFLRKPGFAINKFRAKYQNLLKMQAVDKLKRYEAMRRLVPSLSVHPLMNMTRSTAIKILESKTLSIGDSVGIFKVCLPFKYADWMHMFNHAITRKNDALFSKLVAVLRLLEIRVSEDSQIALFHDILKSGSTAMMSTFLKVYTVPRHVLKDGLDTLPMDSLFSKALYKMNPGQGPYTLSMRMLLSKELKGIDPGETSGAGPSQPPKIA